MKIQIAVSNPSTTAPGGHPGTYRCRIVAEFSLCLSLILLAVGYVGCVQSPPTARHGVELRAMAVPLNVYSIAGEVRAFVAAGEPGARSPARVSLADLQKQFGAFKTGRAMAFDAKGSPIGMTEFTVSADGGVTFDAVTGQQYLLYADVNPRIRPTYGVLCRLSKANLPGDMIPRVCQQILCLGQAFPASDLTKRVPGLDKFVSGLGNEMIGGIDPGGGPRPVGPGGGNICDQCLPQNVVYPEPDCSSGRLPPPGPAACGDSDRVVFVRRESTPVNTSNTRIRIMQGTGTDVTALTAGDHNDQDPDVSLHGGQVVFVRLAGNQTSLFTVGSDGAGLTEVAGSAGASSPVWGRGPESFLVFTKKIGATAQTAIFRIGPGGGSPVQVTFPAAGQNDDQAAVVDAKDLVFTRTGTFGRQLFIQDIFSGGPATQLTTFPDAAVNSPVAGHVRDDNLIAFVADFSAFQSDEIHVGRLNLAHTALENLHTIQPGAPFDHNILGLDFSSADGCLFFGAITKGAAGQPDARAELFSIGFDGSALKRLTQNTVLDSSPSVITP